MARLFWQGIAAVFTPPNTPGQVNISGVVGTGAAGTATGLPFNSVSATGQVGSISILLSPTTLGVEGAGQVGTLVPSSGIVGVQGTGQVGTATASNANALAGVAAIGQVGSLFPGPTGIVVGVFGIGSAQRVYPIPPAPTTRPPLFIPASTEGTPASLWLGNPNN